MSEIEPLFPGETVSQALDRIVRSPILRANCEGIYKINKETGEMEFYFDSEEVREELKGDVQYAVLGNMSRRKKNILKREGD